MSEECDNGRQALISLFNSVPEELRFMLRKISVQQYLLVYWFTVPEFTEELLRRVSSHETIDDEVVLSLMTEIYKDYFILHDKETAGEYLRPFMARRAIRRLHRVLGSNPDPVMNSVLHFKPDLRNKE